MSRRRGAGSGAARGVVRRAAVLLCAGLLAAGCTSARPDPEFDPLRSLVEVVALLESGAGADLYRFDPPRDLTGENLFRASLARLDRCAELLGADGSTRAGRDGEFVPAIAYARARALERLLDFAAAADAYRSVAEGSSRLARPAAQAAWVPEALALILARDAAVEGSLAPDQLLLRLAHQRRQLKELLEDRRLADDPRACLVRVALERLDVREREFLWRTRALYPNGPQVALDAARQVVDDHQESRRVLEHSLRLADMYAELARSYVAAIDPLEREFDSIYARNLIQSAAQIYAEVAAVDGRPEREEARAALAGLEALGQRLRGGP